MNNMVYKLIRRETEMFVVALDLSGRSRDARRSERAAILFVSRLIWAHMLRAQVARKICAHRLGAQVGRTSLAHRLGAQVGRTLRVLTAQVRCTRLAYMLDAYAGHTHWAMGMWVGRLHWAHTSSALVGCIQSAHELGIKNGAYIGLLHWARTLGAFVTI